MKKLIAVILIATACNAPLQVTTKSDPNTTTSGTLGSARFNNQPPVRDTPVIKRPDTLNVEKGGLPK